ncbi:MAG TPA: PilZ domain-containing protein [Blastocatellia bacterium]|nr:PilZ domain-containing protein [Blastocatellia bacterium]
MVGFKPDKLRKAQERLTLPERRGARRFAVGWNVTIKGTDGKGREFDETGVLQNLSSSGAFLYLTRPLGIGSKVDVRIRLPFQKENWMRYEAEVVRVEGGQLKTGIGMHFCAVWPIFQSE